MSVIEIDRHWDEAAKALEVDGGIVVTKNGKIIGKLVPPVAKLEKTPKNRFVPEENRKRREKLWGKGVMIDSLSGLLEDREDR